MKPGNRIGYIFFCLLPMLLGLTIQNLLSVPFVGISVMMTFLDNYQSGITPQELTTIILERFTDSSFTLSLSAVYACVGLLVFGFWYWKRASVTAEKVSFKHALNPWILLSLVFLAVGMQYVTTYLMNFLAAIRPDWMARYENLVNTAGLNKISFLVILYGCILGPVLEELIFRGLTFHYAKKALPVFAAIAYQGLLFGIYHLNIIQGIYACLLGILIGYVYEKGGTILISIILHILFNVCGVFISPYMFYGSEQPFFFLLWLTVGVLLTFSGIFLFQHGLAVREIEQEALS